jgi:magnesium transporter
MTRSRRSRRRSRPHLIPPGTAPGTLAVDPEAPRPVISVVAYGPDRLVEETVQSPARLGELIERWPVTWINVDGLGDPSVVAEIGRLLDLHRLSLEDVTDVHQRAKVETYDHYLYIVARILQPCDRLETEQLSLFIGKKFVVTFQEMAGDHFDPVRRRLRDNKGHIRSGADYLGYALLDAAIDAYFPILEQLGERLEEIEDEIVLRPARTLIAKIHAIKRDLLTLRRAVWPLREALTALIRDPTDLVGKDTRLYLRDCYDHAIQLIDLLENYRELGSSLTDAYLSSLGMKTNEVMKVLTIIATIFIPLSFIASLYGMNFNTEKSPYNMPELTWRFGYPFALGLMAATAGSLLLYFWRRGWLSSEAAELPPPVVYGPPVAAPPSVKARGDEPPPGPERR